jgi:hypothetical protein
MKYACIENQVEIFRNNFRITIILILLMISGINLSAGMNPADQVKDSLSMDFTGSFVYQLDSLNEVIVSMEEELIRIREEKNMLMDLAADRKRAVAVMAALMTLVSLFMFLFVFMYLSIRRRRRLDVAELEEKIRLLEKGE